MSAHDSMLMRSVPAVRFVIAIFAGVFVTGCNESQVTLDARDDGVAEEWDKQHPNTQLAVVKALIRAGEWLDETAADGKLVNRQEAAKILSMKDDVSADEDVIDNSMTGTFLFQKTDVREMPDFNVFFKYYASYPQYSDCIWFLTQMRRWGQITEPRPASWYAETAKEIYKPEIYRKAAELRRQDRRQ